MKGFSDFPNGFTGGLTVRGLALLNSYSNKVWYVGSNAEANGDGSFNRPFLTIDEAINRCKAGKGDVIVCKPAHAETITTATAINADISGVTILGMGTGGNRPTLTFGAAAATIPVSAANVTFQNILFVANFADVASLFTLTTAADFALVGCEFKDTSAILNFLAIVTTTVAVVADGLVFVNNRVSSLGTTAATTCIKILGTHDRLLIADNLIVMAVLNNTAAVLAHGALVVTNLEMVRNRVFRPNTDTATGGLLVTTTSTTNTGMICENQVTCLDVIGIILVTSGSKYGLHENYAAGDANSSGLLLPVAHNDAA